TTCAPRCGSRRSPISAACGSTPTTASASARTVPPTSRSSTTRRCGRSRTCSSSAQGTPTRRCGRGGSPSRTGTDRRPSPSPATRQNVPALDRGRYASAEGTRRGAYVLNPDVQRPDIALLATGSELHLIVAAEGLLQRRGIRARLVSMPCWELFDEQPASYRDEVLPPTLAPRLAVEAGVSLGWPRWIPPRRALLTLHRHRASAPRGPVMRALGLTPGHVAPP